MENLLRLVDKLFPVPSQYRFRVKKDVAELSRLLTENRGERQGAYLNTGPALSAYLRYFLPWNIYRLVRLLPALPLSLKDGDSVTDLGSGPLTLPIAFWIARPELRGLELEFRCIDRTAKILDAGLKLFSALSGGGDGAWTVKTIRADIRETHSRRPSPPAAKSALVCAVNVYNEFFGKIPHTDHLSLAEEALREGQRLDALAAPGGSILVVEPGVPRSGEFIASLRDALERMGRGASAPCTHRGACPWQGGKEQGKQKWCHFAFSSGDAPKKLKDLSALAGIPKERAVLSFLLTGAEAMMPSPAGNSIPVRVMSDAFPVKGAGGGALNHQGGALSHRDGALYQRGGALNQRGGGLYGRYGCSPLGAVLLSGSGEALNAVPAGTLLHLPPPEKKMKDPKSGALVFVI
jgi:hypothetical protein